MTERKSAARLGGLMAASLREATGQGYRLGYEIARDEAAFIALEAGRPGIADRIRGLAAPDHAMPAIARDVRLVAEVRHRDADPRLAVGA
ncbi:MAG: hypothetical protein RMK90_08310 [Acetobacteraceae bacterium]|nr:hypothetical protein [Acetobacteraceae bacterium]